MLSFSGLEFTVQENFLKSNGISLIHTKSGIKSTKSERAIRTLLKKIHKLMFISSSPTWIDTLPSIQESYNNTPSRSLLDYSPQQVLDSPSVRKKFQGILLKKLWLTIKNMKKQGRSPYQLIQEFELLKLKRFLIKIMPQPSVKRYIMW